MQEPEGSPTLSSEFTFLRDGKHDPAALALLLPAGNQPGQVMDGAVGSTGSQGLSITG